MNVKQIKTLFLRQSYLDAIKEYERFLEHEQDGWDYVVLTASNEEQAYAYRKEIETRKQEHSIPTQCEYVVLPDPEGKRVGSGGATLNVLKYIALQAGESSNPFAKKKILVIHSGGDSKRVPQYSVCGKLFSPVPRENSLGKASTLFDEFIILMSSVVRRINEGMLVLSGDVLLLFNPLQLDFQFKGAAAISIKESADIGQNHGVFLCGEDNYVKSFLHKHSKDTLERLGAVNEKGNVDLDTGAVLFDVDLMNDLYALIATDGKLDEAKFGRFVNEKARISFYGDFLYPLAQDATIEDYCKQAPEGEMCEELIACRYEIWDRLNRYRMKVYSLSPAEFIHFGTTAELLGLVSEEIESYEFLDWSANVASNIEENAGYSTSTSIIKESQINKDSYIENSYLERVTVGAGSIVSGLRLTDIQVPERVVAHGVPLRDGNFVVRIYGVNDNPKAKLESGAVFLKNSIKMVLRHYEISLKELWDDEEYLWFARFYAVAKNETEAFENALLLYRIFSLEASKEEVFRWLSLDRVSLYTSFNNADINEIRRRQVILEDEVVKERFILRLLKGRSSEEALAVFDRKAFDKEVIEYLVRRAEKAELSLKMRIYQALSRSSRLENTEREEYMRKCFAAIREAVCAATEKNKTDLQEIKKEYVKIELPVRVNWGGGWTDTPPYCLEHGGTVLNAAIKLNGIKPVCVEMKRIKEMRIKVSSGDIGVEGYIDTPDELFDCSNPYDYFALHKAALVACGLVGERSETSCIKDILRKIGGGFELSTKVVGVPKGSGLGTSSILAAACVRAIFSFFGNETSDGEIYRTVSCIEQLMSTGGGWQDQVGGLTEGVKFITTAPGTDQNISVEYVELSEAAKEELKERFALIYTGQRRLARNLLRDVVGNYIAARKESIEALDEMKKVAVKMRRELECGDIDAFANLMNRHWELSLQLDSGATNTCIDYIFLACEDYIDGRFVAGAGGGGFLQVILKKGVTKEMLRERLKTVFQETGIDVWECELIWR